MELMILILEIKFKNDENNGANSANLSQTKFDRGLK